jgi:hypothetical protein
MMTDDPRMTDEPRRVVADSERTRHSGSPLGVFLAVALILAAVVGGAMLMNQGVNDQASVTTSGDSSTGASTGETGATTPAPAPDAPTPAPEQKPETPPASP